MLKIFAKKTSKCPTCGAPVLRSAKLCPVCGQEFEAQQSKECPDCGARMLSSQDKCPICGAERQVEASTPPIGAWALAAGILSIVAFLGAVWFLRPWAEKAVATSVGPTATATRTPLRQPTIVMPTATSTRTLSPTRTKPPTPSPTETPVPPTATPTAAPQESPQPATHVVKSGDNLGALAVKYGVTADAIAQANNITLRTMLSIGQKLIIPGVGGPAPTQTVAPNVTIEPTQTPTPGPTQTPSAVHVIARGDTLGAIAVKYNVSVEAIARANNITPVTILQLGQELVIPGVEDPAVARVTPSPSSRLSEATAVPAPSTPEATKPASAVHVVKSGDNLGSLAVEYDVEVEDIAKANDMTVRSILRIGQELTIPGITIPTPTATPEPTATATATQTATPEPTPTRVPTSNLPFQAPCPLAPINGSTIEGASSGVLLNWTSVGILAEQQWYAVQIWQTEDDFDPTITYIKATSLRLDPEMYPKQGNACAFLWQVTVVEKSSEHEAFVALSPKSEIYEFFWH